MHLIPFASFYERFLVLLWPQKTSRTERPFYCFLVIAALSLALTFIWPENRNCVPTIPCGANIRWRHRCPSACQRVMSDFAEPMLNICRRAEHKSTFSTFGCFHRHRQTFPFLSLFVRVLFAVFFLLLFCYALLFPSFLFGYNPILVVNKIMDSPSELCVCPCPSKKKNENRTRTNVLARAACRRAARPSSSIYICYYNILIPIIE